MAGKADSKLRAIGTDARSTTSSSVVGDEITRHLRQLQAERRAVLEVDAVIAALVPAIATLAEQRMLVSVAITPDGRSVRLSTLIGKEWIPWYVPDAETAEELVHQIEQTFAS